MAKRRRSSSGWLDIAVVAWWAMINSDAPVLVGIAAGLLGAAGGAIAGLVLEPAGSVGQGGWAIYGAGLVGYAIGGWCGVVVCNRRRGAPGSIWLALLGALSGVTLGLAFWGTIGRSIVMGTAEQFREPAWILYLGLIGLAALIPGLASLAYDFKPPFGLLETRAPSGTGPECTPAGRPEETGAPTPANERADRRPNKALQSRVCKGCGMANPPGSIFCGKCRGLLWKTGT